MYIDLSLIGFSLESNNVYGSISDIVQVSSVNVHILLLIIIIKNN